MNDREYPQHPLTGVGVVVWRGDHVLLIRRGKPPRLGEWSLPGGLQHVGETVFEAAVRECLEETGIAIRPLRHLDVIDSIRRDAEGRVRFHYTLIDVAGEYLAGEPQAGDDAMHAEWVHRDRVAGLGMWSETVRLIRLADQALGSAESAGS
jgi:8-oxo-dGTP diphosphatase